MNGAAARGGGIYMRGGTLTLTNTVVQYNVAQGGAEATAGPAARAAPAARTALRR